MPKLLRHFYSLLVISLIAFFTFKASNEEPLNMLGGDAKGYYAYLPALFIHHTYDCTVLDSSYKDYSADFNNRVNSHNLNKYPIGMSLLNLPFFSTAYTLSSFGKSKVNGLENIFQLSVLVASIFYFLVAVYVLIQFLLSYSLTAKYIAITLGITICGTNLIYYILYEPGMSHAYGFFCITTFMYAIRRHCLSKEVQWLYLGAILYGLAILVRPTHAIILCFVPLLSVSTNYNWKKVSLKIWMATFLISILMLVPQMFIWYKQVDKWIVYSYQGEGFNFCSPELTNFLFSFRKGLFIYTPVLLLSLFGLVKLFIKDIKQGFLFLLPLILIVYLYASWHNWYYGDGFGQRVTVDYYAFFSLLIAIGIKGNKKVVNYLLILTVGALVSLNLIQTYQYKVGILHADSMNFNRYKYLFLKTDKKQSHSFPGFPEHFYAPEGTILVSSKRVLEENQTYHLLPKEEYSITFEQSISLEKNKRYYIKVNLTHYRESIDLKDDARVVVSLQNDNHKTVFWKNERLFSPLMNVTDNKYKGEFGFNIPSKLNGTYKLKAYVWNPNAVDLYLTDFEVHVMKAN